MKPLDLSLYLITDDRLINFDKLSSVVSVAVENGVTTVQFRAKNSNPDKIIMEGKALKKICDSKNIPLIVNDNLSVAKALDAAGIHLGQDDLTPDIARRELGKDKIIGRSIENLSQAKMECYQDYVDYYGIGPVFFTQTKTDAAPTIGCDELKKIRQLLNKPCVAIGGINEKNAFEVIQTGVDGLAVVSAILLAENVASTTQQIKKIIDQKNAKI